MGDAIRHCYECDEVLIKIKVLDQWAWACPNGCAEWWILSKSIKLERESLDRDREMRQLRRQQILSAVGGRFTEVMPHGAIVRGGGSKSGRRRKKPLKAKRWYQE